MSVIIYILGSILLLLLLLAFIYFKFLRYKIFRLPLKRKGFKHAPAYPFSVKRTVTAVIGLLKRAKAVEQAKFGLAGSFPQDQYEIDKHKGTAYAFCYAKNNHKLKENAYTDLLKQLQLNPFLLFGLGNPDESQGYKTESESDASGRKSRPYLEEIEEKSSDKESFDKKTKASSDNDSIDLTVLSLDRPEQYDLSWTTFGNIKAKASAKLKGEWVKSLTDPAEATKQFFPTISKYGVAYNLLILQKVKADNLKQFKAGELSKVWTSEMDKLCTAGKLYVIDMRIFNTVTPQITNEKPEIWSYTPATFVWLKQDDNKDITPFAVYIEGYDTKYIHKGRKTERISTEAQFYSFAANRDTTWIYALQAAKVSITVFGIWLGHVYPWHMVTAAMSMTLYNNVNEKSFLYQLLGEKCNYLIGFNDALYLKWKTAAPPTSINTTTEFLKIVDKYATNRGFFADDPKAILKAANIKEEDFSINTPWDKYPMIKYLLAIWDNVEQYAHKYVDICYGSEDKKVKEDKNLQKWIQKSIKKGNIQGLSKIESTAALKEFLTSFMYRFTAHGLSRLDNTANPAMTFIPNFPPTLHIKENPAPDTQIKTEELMKYLPKTGTVGKMMDFYFTFADSAPYINLIPVDGIDQHLHFSNVGKSRSTENLNHAGLDRDTGKASKLNLALVQFRSDMRKFMDTYNAENKIEGFEPDPVQYNQWPLGVET